MGITMKYIALLSAVPFETDNILDLLTRVRITEIAGKPVYQGSLVNINILIMHTGIGKVNAARAATSVIEGFPVHTMVNLGIGGAYPGAGLSLGDIAIASQEIYGDEGVAGSGGWADMKAIGMPVLQRGRKKYFNEFPLNLHHSLFKKWKKRGGLRQGDFHITSGNFVTVSTVSGTHKRAMALRRRFHAICENMEGAAIAQVCTLYNVPLVEVRGISNIAGVRDKRKWDIEGASEHCQEVVIDVIEGLSK
jgi:futalosine hydrolase